MKWNVNQYWEHAVRQVMTVCLLTAFAVTNVQTVVAMGGDEPASPAKSKEAPDETDGDNPAAKPINPFPDARAVPPGILDCGAEWLNTSGPIDLKELRGKVVLLDFWTYCCINCIHVLPDLKFLEEKYEKQLVVIGVHSAKFANEKLSDNIRDAILRYEIKHPVVNDNEMIIWRRFGTSSWPTLALIDPEGKFIGRQPGEGNRELFDQIIGRIVDYHRANGTLDESPVVFDLEENRAKKTPLRFPGKVLADQSTGRLFISDSNHNRIVVTDLNGVHQFTIGSGQIGRSDGAFDKATFDHPQGMELVGDKLYVADTENHMIRVADLTSQKVSTLAGTGRQGRPRNPGGSLASTSLNSPWDLCHIGGTLFIAMAGPHQIWSHRIGSDEIRAFAGNAREDIINGDLDNSSFAQPSGLTADGSGEFFYVADSEGSSIRKVPVSESGEVTTVAGTSELPRGQSLFAFGDVDGTGAKARFQHPLGVAWHDGSVFVADAYNHKIRRVDLETNAVETWLGTGKAGDSVDPVQLSEPAGLSIAGDILYIADTNNHRVCTVNLKTKQFTPLTLDGVSPPRPVTSRRVPDFSQAEVVPEQTLRVGATASVIVDVNVPDGFKLNSLAPVTWELFQVEGDQVIAPAGLQGRATAQLAGSSASFEIPLTGESGQAELVAVMSYGYCDKESESVCRLATAMWKFKLVLNDATEASELKLRFPDAKPLAVSSEE